MDKNNANTERTRMHGDLYSLFFIKPDGCPNAHASAERLMRLKGVAEVMVTSGSYAFVVKSQPGKPCENLRQSLGRRHGPPAVLECHYHYTH